MIRTYTATATGNSITLIDNNDVIYNTTLNMADVVNIGLGLAPTSQGVAFGSGSDFIYIPKTQPNLNDTLQQVIDFINKIAPLMDLPIPPTGGLPAGLGGGTFVTDSTVIINSLTKIKSELA